MDVNLLMPVKHLVDVPFGYLDEKWSAVLAYEHAWNMFIAVFDELLHFLGREFLSCFYRCFAAFGSEDVFEDDVIAYLLVVDDFVEECFEVDDVFTENGWDGMDDDFVFSEE